MEQSPGGMGHFGLRRFIAAFLRIVVGTLRRRESGDESPQSKLPLLEKR
jgi:hypothetical protein